MRIVCELSDVTVRKACVLVEQHYKDDDFRPYFKDVHFNHTTFQGIHAFEIAKMNLENQIVIVKPYQTWNPWSNVIGYAVNESIFVNTRKLYLPLVDRIENIIHEAYHLAGFSHKGNRVTEYNLKTVPYLASSLFVKYLRDKEII
jgi:hypothetical protein